MATLLQGVNAVLKRSSRLNNAEELTSLTDAARQGWIDVAVQCWNEVIIELYDLAGKPFPSELTRSTITLATGTRAYSLPSDLIKLNWPLHDQDNGHYIHEFPAGFINLEQLWVNPSLQEGLPNFGAIRPTDNLLYFDRSPNAGVNGRVYTYYYDKELVVSAGTDNLPMNNTAYNAVIPAVVEKFRVEFDNGILADNYLKYMGIAAGHLNFEKPREEWF